MAEPNSNEVPGRGYRLARNAVAVVGVALGAWYAWANRFLQDDAYISFQYARNLAEGHGLVYNPGEYVEGYTNFLWTLLVAVGMVLGMRAGDVAQGLGILSFLGSLLLVVAIAEQVLSTRRTATDALPLTAVWVLALNPSAAAYATGGLATAFFGFLSLLTVYVWSRWPRWSALPVLLLCLTRPEGPLLWVLLIGVRATQVPLKQVAREHAPFLGVLALYAAWKLYYYGDLLPNTFYAKSAHDPYPSRGWTFLRSYYEDYPHLGLALLAPLALVWNRSPWRLVGLLAAFHVLFTIYVLWVGGGFMEYKTVLHALPAGVAVFAAGCALLREARGSWLAGLAVGMALLATPSVDRSINILPVDSLRRQMTSFSWVRYGQTLGETLPSDTVISASAAGAIPFFSRLRNVDSLGLTERAVARQELAERGVVGHEKVASNDYLRSRGVNLRLYLLKPKKRADIEVEDGDMLYVRVQRDTWVRARYLVQSPELTAHMRGRPDDFLLPRKLR